MRNALQTERGTGSGVATERRHRRRHATVMLAFAGSVALRCRRFRKFCGDEMTAGRELFGASSFVKHLNMMSGVR